jgi:hypothetical protein
MVRSIFQLPLFNSDDTPIPASYFSNLENRLLKELGQGTRYFIQHMYKMSQEFPKEREYVQYEVITESSEPLELMLKGVCDELNLESIYFIASEGKVKLL